MVQIVLHCREATPERPGYRMYGGHVVAKAASVDPDKLSILALAATGSR